MITARDSVIAAFLLLLGLVLGVGVSVGDEPSSLEPGQELYTPTRLEWLAVVLNAENPHDDLDRDGYRIVYLAPGRHASGEAANRILVQVKHRPDTQIGQLGRAEMKLAERRASNYGWDWAKVGFTSHKLKDYRPPANIGTQPAERAGGVEPIVDDSLVALAFEAGCITLCTHTVREGKIRCAVTRILKQDAGSPVSYSVGASIEDHNEEVDPDIRTAEGAITFFKRSQSPYSVFINRGRVVDPSDRSKELSVQDAINRIETANNH
jgi:hypothetical protein